MISACSAARLSAVAWRSGLAASIGCMIVQVRENSGVRERATLSSSKRRYWIPSEVTLSRTRLTITSASRILLARRLAARNIRVGAPSNSWITASWLKVTRETGRETRANTRPVLTAAKTRPKKVSTVMIRLAAKSCGYQWP